MIASLLALATATTAPATAPPREPPQWIIVATVRSARFSGWYYDHCRERFYEMGGAEDEATMGPDDCMNVGGDVFDVRLDIKHVIHGPPGASLPRRVGVMGLALDFGRREVREKKRVYVLSPTPSERLRKATKLDLLAERWDEIREYTCFGALGKVVRSQGGERIPLEPLRDGCFDLQDLRWHYAAPEAKTTPDSP